jgi:hypothetical protein
MIMVFKIVTALLDSMISRNFIGSHSVTRGNRYNLTPKHVHYNLTKFAFAKGAVFIGISLPDYVVCACAVKVFEKRLDFFGRNLECLHKKESNLSAIKNRSYVYSFFAF